MSLTQTTPEVLWAQRSSTTDADKNYIHLTISAQDTPKIDVDLKATSLTFTGHSDTKKTTYHVALEFFGEIDVENSKTIHTSRDVEFVLRKKDLKEEYWPRLVKDKKKVHFIKTNFDKWVDEDDQNAAPEDDALGGMGGMGGMSGMQGMEGLGGLGGMGGLGDEEGGFSGVDFSKLGDLSGAGDGAGGGLDDDDDMPSLEDEQPTEEAGKKPEATEKEPVEEVKSASSTPSAKIEEVS